MEILNVPLLGRLTPTGGLDTAWSAAGVATLASLLVLGIGSVLIGRTLAARAELRRLRETL